MILFAWVSGTYQGRRLTIQIRENKPVDISQEMKERKHVDVGEVWWFWFTTNAFDVDKRLRRIFRILPHDPRCKFCNAPFQGIGGTLVRVIFGKQRSDLNPRYCNLCEIASRNFPGGAEVEMSMLFADVRGSMALSEQMSPAEFSQLISRFYIMSTKIITKEDGLVDGQPCETAPSTPSAGIPHPQLQGVRSGSALVQWH
jgi:hypothetical protein